ncbi:RICIN domain-containing protein [uncultured Prevotella sp.]|uniref:RICIN domain-containing protein n=1 Tax=uncultured Prevotella sp. TaxID=159272 RepID=UPI00338E2658
MMFNGNRIIVRYSFMRGFAIKIMAFLVVAAITSCNDTLDQSLELAGDNRQELEKVLAYFEDDEDPLKYEAACFLIENMPYHYAPKGENVDYVDSVYLAMSEYPKEQREKVFKELLKAKDLPNGRPEIDIRTVKADYLIKSIDEACDFWHEVAWSKEYDTSLFFDYVLPYRLLDEPQSDWKKTIRQVFPLLHQNKILSTRGWRLEAETLKLKNCSASDKAGASHDKYVQLNQKGAKVSFDVYAVSACYKNLILRYSATKRNSCLDVMVNDKHIDTLRLAPTNDTNSFRMSKNGYILQLNKGINRVSLACVGDTIGLDYVQVGAIEDCEERKLEDYSQSYCMIKNVMNGGYITFDTLSASILNQIEVKPLRKNDSTQMVRMDYHGRACWRISAFKTDSIDLCMEVQYASTDTGTAVSQYKYIGGNNQKWAVLPIGNGLSRIMSKDTGLFLDIKKDEKTGKTVLVQNPYSGEKSQQWKIERKGRNNKADSKCNIGSVYSEALRVHEVMGQFEWVYFSTGFAPKASSMMEARTGNCRDEASYTVFLSRSLGIPATIDFTPHWGNRSWGHHWSVIVQPNGKAIPFYMGSMPGDTAQFFHPYVKTKVFRRRFQLNRQIAMDMREEKSVPNLFQTPDWTDVTDEYCPTTDVTRNVPEKYKDKKIAYICIFDNNDWLPVYYGVIRDGAVTFPNMGRRVMYISAFYENGQIVPFGTPFSIGGDGKVSDVQVDTKRRCTLNLLRKYPYFSAEDPINTRMKQGRFQGANTADFSKPTDLYCFNEVTNGGWYEFPVTDTGRYRYLRYSSPDASYGNINELWFFDEKGDTIKGDIIGTEGADPDSRERVFDNNILTGFNGKSPDGNWVGLRLKVPKRVAKLRFIPRNDGNCIEIGDKYELRLWTNTKWKVIATVKAKADILCLKNVPRNGLYVLKDLTKGNEQRIFTYENNKQVWW